MTTDTDLGQAPVGPGGLRFGVSQVSLVVHDLDALVRLYHDTFGWAPWKVYDHVEPVHHATELRGESVPYSLRGAEVQVGSLNFELLQPLDGPNIWREQLDATGEGVCSIATMFHTRAEGDLVREQFRDRFGLGITMRAEIGDHIEYYYLDTQERFGAPIESGSGHALDFMKPTYDYPAADAEWIDSPAFGIRLPLTQVSLVVRDLDAKLAAYRDGFGWRPWRVFDSESALSDATYRGGSMSSNVRWAETMVGDLNVELVEPLGGASPWQDFLERRGEGIVSISVGVPSLAEASRVKAGFAARGVGVLADGRIGNQQWFLLDGTETYKCLIKVATGHGLDSDAPGTDQP
jgi:methylmalonyl-CoA/ethylmalonyl-CoA epimerase